VTVRRFSGCRWRDGSSKHSNCSISEPLRRARSELGTLLVLLLPEGQLPGICLALATCRCRVSRNKLLDSAEVHWSKTNLSQVVAEDRIGHVNPRLLSQRAGGWVENAALWLLPIADRHRRPVDTASPGVASFPKGLGTWHQGVKQGGLGA
jgi:hypothetical protein